MGLGLFPKSATITNEKQKKKPEDKNKTQKACLTLAVLRLTLGALAYVISVILTHREDPTQRKMLTEVF